MLQFTNGFACAVDGSKSEFIINFIQNHPTFDKAGNVSDAVTEPVVSVIMQKDTAAELASAITTLLSSDGKV